MILDDVRKDTDYCTYCPKMCRFSCPVSETELRETLTPTGKQTIVHLVREGALELTDESVEIFFKCTGCLHCQVYCLHGIDVPRSLEAARTHAYLEGKTLSSVFQAAERFHRFGNPLGRRLVPELRELAPPEWFGRESRVLLFPGAHLIAERPGVLRQLLAVLSALGVEAALPREEILSAGMELLDWGDRAGFAAHAKEVRKLMEPYAVVLCPAPQDAHALKNRYGEFGQSLGGRVAGFAEFLLERLEASPLPLKKLDARKVVYHDPCTLARRLGTIDAPRQLLARCGVEVGEAPWHGRDANCCGAGGGYADVFPREATRMAQGRLDECGAPKGIPLATLSPRCESHLLAAGGGRSQVVSVIEILAEALGVQAGTA